jgi:hypothetical protein
MSADCYISFATEPEARAFLEGVQFVNDSAIEVHGLFLIPKAAVPMPDATDTFVAHLTDRDRSEDESDDLPDGLESPLRTRLSVG